MSRSGIAATECPFFEHRTCSVMSDTLNISLRSRFRNRSCVGAPGRSTVPREVAITCASNAEVAILGQNPSKNRTRLPPRHRNRTPLPPRAPEQHKITAWSARPAQNRHLERPSRTKSPPQPAKSPTHPPRWQSRAPPTPRWQFWDKIRPKTARGCHLATETSHHCHLERPSNTESPPGAPEQHKIATSGGDLLVRTQSPQT